MQNLILQSVPKNRLEIFCRSWAAFGLLLFAVTWKLWTPQTEFPQIPFFEFLIDVPGIVDWIALSGVVLSLAICVLGKSTWLARTLLTFVLSTVILMLLNQHRLQPWAYQHVGFAIILATTRTKSAFFWLRLIAISIYLYSAISKFDYQFVHTTGRSILWSLTELLGQTPKNWPESLQNWLTLGFPIGELVLGLLLLFSKTRKFGVVAAVIAHTAILAAVINLGHSPGVIVWNLYFIAQSILLFGFEFKDNGTNESTKQRPYEFAGICVAMFVLLFPITRPFGICDHWIAWEVYAPRCSRAKLICHDDSDRWSHLLNWSEATTTVPIYPQARFQLAVCMATQQRFDKAKGLSIEVAQPSEWWTGERETTTLTRPDQVKMFAARYWLNLKPRSFWNTD